MSSTAERSAGRIVRIIAVASLERKMEVVMPRPAASVSAQHAGEASSVSSRVAATDGARLIFNEVPSRDLDTPHATSDFEEYLSHADGAVIVADTSDDNWVAVADRWR